MNATYERRTQDRPQTMKTRIKNARYKVRRWYSYLAPICLGLMAIYLIYRGSR